MQLNRIIDSENSENSENSANMTQRPTATSQSLHRPISNLFMDRKKEDYSGDKRV
jgi:hypothetical protein